MKRIGLNPARLTLRSSKHYIISQSHSAKLNPHSHINPIFRMLEKLLEIPSSVSSWLHSSTVWAALILIETAFISMTIGKIQKILNGLFSSQVSKRCVYLYQVTFLGNFLVEIAERNQTLPLFPSHSHLLKKIIIGYNNNIN